MPANGSALAEHCEQRLRDEPEGQPIPDPYPIAAQSWCNCRRTSEVTSERWTRLSGTFADGAFVTGIEPLLWNIAFDSVDAYNAALPALAA